MSSDLPSTLFSTGSSLATDALFLRALRCENKDDRPPIWIMRQAGRCLPAYRKLREKYSLEELFRHPELIHTVTKLPLEHLGVDAAILFADILHVALALGCTVHFPPQGGVEVSPCIQSQQDLLKLAPKPVSETLGFVDQGIRLLKQDIEVPLIGFAGGPFTLATYLAKKKIKTWIYSDPQSFHQLLEAITDTTIEYLKMQIEAGVDAIQLFDSWADKLSKPQFQIFALPYLRKIKEALPPDFPLLIFCRGSTHFVQELVSLKPSGISLDGFSPLWEMRRRVPATIALQGNLDPELLYAPPEVIIRETENLLRCMSGDPGFIVNLGHGVLPDTPFDHVKCFVETVTKWQREA